MKVIENHYGGNPTVIINKRIINGCQDFTIDELEDVAEAYEATEERVQQVRDAYAEDQINPTDPMEFIEREYDIKHDIAMYGEDRHRDVLAHDKEPNIRFLVVQYGNEKHWEIIRKQPDCPDWLFKHIMDKLQRESSK